MCEVAAHLTEHVLPHLPARQWVLSVPKRLRPFLHHNRDVATAVLRVFLRAISYDPASHEPGSAGRRPAGGRQLLAPLRLEPQRSPHYHIVVPDGVFSTAPDREVRFHEASELAPNHCHELQPTLQRRVLRYFNRRGLLDELAATATAPPPSLFASPLV